MVRKEDIEEKREGGQKKRTGQAIQERREGCPRKGRKQIKRDKSEDNTKNDWTHV